MYENSSTDILQGDIKHAGTDTRVAHHFIWIILIPSWKKVKDGGYSLKTHVSEGLIIYFLLRNKKHYAKILNPH